jgi:large subunit ribosomal protein L25
MSEITLVAESGRSTGSPASRRLRAEDHIPAVVYGQGLASTPVTINRRDLRLALSTPAGLNAVINLTFNGVTKPAVVKDMQRHPVRRTVQHVDFLVVDLDVAIEVEVPITMVGEPKAVLDLSGLVDLQVSTITVRTTPRNIPDALTIDVSDMTIGATKHADQVALPKGVELAMDPEAVIVSAEATRATVEAAAAEGDAAEGDAAKS